MKTNPLDVPSVVIKSTSGGAALEAVFQSTREQSKALHADGFAWCKEDMVLLRVHVLPEATVADLVAIGALCASYAVDECLLRTRAFLCPYAFGGVHQACKAGGFAFRKGVGWAKAMGADEWCALQSVAGTRSAEAWLWMCTVRRRASFRAVHAQGTRYMSTYSTSTCMRERPLDREEYRPPGGAPPRLAAAPKAVRDRRGAATAVDAFKFGAGLRWLPPSPDPLHPPCAPLRPPHLCAVARNPA